MRYPMEQYDDHTFPKIVLREAHSRGEFDDSDDSLFGPIVIYKRKKHFRQAEKEAIWLTSRRRCHLCGKRWGLKQRSQNGWHIDHVIPNVGGGKDTEGLANFRVACARCNLKKGRGYTERTIREALKQMFL
jgi:5-methylcytosine-specific restriction endonuclease McrA